VVDLWWICGGSVVGRRPVDAANQVSTAIAP